MECEPPVLHIINIRYNLGLWLWLAGRVTVEKPGAGELAGPAGCDDTEVSSSSQEAPGHSPLSLSLSPTQLSDIQLVFSMIGRVDTTNTTGLNVSAALVWLYR